MVQPKSRFHTQAHGEVNLNEIDKISEKVEKRKTQLQPLFKKDEENYDLWIGKEQIFGDHKMDVNITGPEMKALAHKTQSSLIRHRLDIHVLPPDKYASPTAKDEANQEERLYYFGLEQADERLITTGKPTLKQSTSWQNSVLGRIVVRVLVYYDKEKDKVVWDILPLNPRFVTFDFDSDGLAWICCETFRNRDSIKRDYNEDVTEEAEGKGISVSEYWDREHNVRFLTKEKKYLKQKITVEGKEKSVTAWKHDFKEVPAIFLPVTLGPRAITAEGIQVTTWGQSVFESVKELFRKLNELRSIWATHAHMLAKSPTEEIYEDGTDPNIEEEHLDFHAGAIVKHPRSIELKPMKQADIPLSLPAMVASLEAGIQRITGTELHPEWAGSSGAALRIAGQDRRDAETPRVDTMNSMYTQICRMLKRQIIVQGLTIPVKTVVNKTYEVFDMAPENLDNDFYVRAELVRQDVYDEVEALQRAQMLMQLRLLSREDVMERVMLEQDVPTQIMKMDMEDIEAEIPEIKLKRMIKFIKEDAVLSKSKEMQETAGMLEQQLGMLIVSKQHAVKQMMEEEMLGGGTPSGGQPAGTQAGQSPRTPAQGVVPGVP